MDKIIIGVNILVVLNCVIMWWLKYFKFVCVFNYLLMVVFIILKVIVILSFE